MAMPNLDTTYPVLILKASRDTIHHGAVGIARTLGRLGVPVYAVVEDRYTPLATSRYLTKAFVWDRWPRDRQTLLSAMATIGEIINRPAILIPIDDLSAISVAENASSLSQWFLLPRLSRELPRQLADKSMFYSLCAGIGVPCPVSIAPRSADDVREFAKHTTFPVVAKAAEQWLLLNDRHNAIVIPNSEALLNFYESTEPEQRSRIILQEYIPGRHWIYHGYCDHEKGLYLGFTGKKLLSYPPSAGSTAVGISVENETLRCLSEKLLAAVSYSGIIDIDWRQDERDGKYKILDCNPRVGMNFRMFENSAGIDVVRAQHLNLTRRSIDCPPMIEGRLFIVEPYYLLAFLRVRRASLPMTSGDISQQPRSKEFAWWNRDDPLPFFVMSVRILFRTVKRATKRAVRWMWDRRTQAAKQGRCF